MMADLIKRAAAIDALTDTELRRNLDSVYDGDMNRTRRAAQRVIAQLPTVDAVQVVRCRDCKYGKLCFDANGQGLIQCTNPYYQAAFAETWPFDLDWYCAGGERREANETGKP
jgi:hypothetical protein